MSDERNNGIEPATEIWGMGGDKVLECYLLR